MTTCDFVIAEMTGGRSRALQLADVIVCHRDCSQQREWGRRVLRRWPGSTVAAARAGQRGCLVAVRGEERPVMFQVSTWPGGRGSPVLLSACAAYAWLMAGRPLASLTRISVRGDGGEFLADLVRLGSAEILETVQRPAEVITGSGQVTGLGGGVTKEPGDARLFIPRAESGHD